MTRDLPGGNFAPPHWSRWFRMIDVALSGGTAVMQGLATVRGAKILEE